MMLTEWYEIKDSQLYTSVLCGEPDSEDSDMWLPFSIELSAVEGFKMAAPEDVYDDATAGKVTIFARSGRNYILDIPYKEYVKMHKTLKSNQTKLDSL